MNDLNLAHYSKKQLFQLFADWGEASFRAEQLYRWIWEKKCSDFNEMLNLSKALRSRLIEEGYQISFPTVLTSQKSSDGTQKILYRLFDGKSVECVWIPRFDKNRYTLCISTQVGCRMGCTFCMTAQQKTERNLSAGEIAAQVLCSPHRDKLTNIVVMGMGEPFDNYEALMEALEIITDPKALSIGPSHVTVSTSGLVPKILKFAKESSCKLAISLNAPSDEIRNQIMPINKAYNLEKLLGAVKEITSKNYPRARKRNDYVTFEYILIKDVNDQPEHAHALIQLLRNIPCKINLLQYNENPYAPYKRPDSLAVENFQKILRSRKVLNFLRKSRGRDIDAACGQLASEHKRKDTPKTHARV